MTKKNVVCKYSPSCFTCPEDDCRIKAPMAVNEILSRSVYNAFLCDPELRAERKAEKERHVGKEPKRPVERESLAQKYTYNGESKTLDEWAEISGINKDTIYRRIKYLGWSMEKALFTPSRKQRKVAR